MGELRLVGVALGRDDDLVYITQHSPNQQSSRRNRRPPRRRLVLCPDAVRATIVTYENPMSAEPREHLCIIRSGELETVDP
jgi:hypothetical protein